MKQSTGRFTKRTAFWVCAVVGVVGMAAAWAANGANTLDDLKHTSIFMATPAPQSVLLAEGQGKGFTNNEGTQKPTVVKVYAIPGQAVGALVAHYEQAYPSYKYRWHADYYFPSPGVSATNLIGEIGTDDVAVYIGLAPYDPPYPSLSIQHAPRATILL